MTDKLLFDITDKIATITFNNPEKLNAFTMEMLVAYRERLEECRTREDVWAIIVTGAGRGFCSGGDTGRMGADTRRHRQRSVRALGFGSIYRSK